MVHTSTNSAKSSGLALWMGSVLAIGVVFTLLLLLDVLFLRALFALRCDGLRGLSLDFATIMPDRISRKTS